MSNFFNKIPKISLWTLAGISIIVVALFYLGGESEPLYVADEALAVPTFTNGLLIWAYVLLFTAAIITVAIQIINFVVKFKQDMKAALKSLAIIVLLVGVIVGSFFLGNGEKMEIIGYEGTDNFGFWAKFTDMCMFSIYTFLGGAFASIIGVNIYKMIKK